VNSKFGRCGRRMFGSMLCAVGLGSGWAQAASLPMPTAEWDWMLSASQTQHRATPWTDKRDAQQTFGALLDVQTRWQQWTGRFALVGDPLWQDNALPNSADTELDLIPYELFWQGPLTLGETKADVTLGKIRLDWGVGYGYRPLDLFLPYQQNPLGIQVEEGPGVALLSLYDATGEWSLVATDASWVSEQRTTPLQRQNQQRGVGLRHYRLSGDSEWQVIGYVDDVRKGLLGASWVSVLNASWEVHGSALYQRRYWQYALPQENHQPVQLKEQHDAGQALLGVNWAGSSGQNVIAEYWYDGRSWRDSQWQEALARVGSLQAQQQPALAGAYAQGFEHTNLMAHNLLVHWSLDKSAWRNWTWSQSSDLLSRVTPTLDVLYAPQDGGVMLTPRVNIELHDSGASSSALELVARYAGGDRHSVYAQIPDRLTFLLNLKGRF
jgi:hypothetical protein